MDSELLEIYTGWFVRIFALQLCTFFLSVVSNRILSVRKFRTRPLVAPSCVLLPVTLNATLLGVLLLISSAAADKW
jgi:ABC-type molybdate transport system permease subunit